MKARASEDEEYAERLGNYAVELQADAEEDREYLQAELDTTLEYHGAILEQFQLYKTSKRS